ncbi:histidinol phosphate aminotransferase [Cognatishimia sp. F0-27]|uniref:histidinol phosphate aminotransferase n=1 Tax=Cognatishimia sp. F0-27 TaxID=2816855 RepID=UPI001D0CD4A2|nr:histidinol phosphate aminotransferase [Cognatishimia sp. F0-27]MCC1494660.1 histidinol phosphate aminotransferase [Cognatishimia sp. F0-27]
MNQNHPGRVENYTNACLVMAFVNLLLIFSVLWAMWGLGAVLVLAAVLNHMIPRLGALRARNARRAVQRGRGTPDAG